MEQHDSQEGMIILHQENEISLQLLFTHNSEGDHYIGHCMGFSDGGIGIWWKTTQLWKTWTKLCIQLWKDCANSADE